MQDRDLTPHHKAVAENIIRNLLEKGLNEVAIRETIETAIELNEEDFTSEGNAMLRYAVSLLSAGNA